MKRFLLLLFFSAAALAADPAYKLDLGLSLRGGSLRVEPVVTGPAGKQLRYQLDIKRDAQGRSASTSQAGTVRLDNSGKGQFAYNAVTVNKGDRYTVTAKVYDGDRLVASEQAVEPKQ